jgi:hypothetical protein
MRRLVHPANVLGYADDAIAVALVLRSVTRRAGPDALARHWPGTPEGLRLVRQLVGLPPVPDPAATAGASCSSSTQTACAARTGNQCTRPEAVVSATPGSTADWSSCRTVMCTPGVSPAA